MANNDESYGEVSDDDSEFEGEQSEIEGELSANEADEERLDCSQPTAESTLTKKAKSKKKKKK